MGNIRKQIFKVITPDYDGYLPSKIFDIFIIVLIISNTFCVIIDTFDGIPPTVSTFMGAFETFSVIVFTIEYLLRLLTADYLYKMPSKKAIPKYIFSFYAVIDLLAILPFYFPFVFSVDLRILRLLRLLRIVRLFKLTRYSNALNTIGSVFKSKAHQLISSTSIVMLLMLITSIIMYAVEHDAQPDVFENALSGMWWAVATLTTVGYGDIFPVTGIGKLLSAVIALLGIGLVAVPTGIISAGFIEHITPKGASDTSEYCPHCGKKLK